MAFIRAFGGGGIPSALKSAMNAVLNKKFGTSTTYAPEDWPADVNLLGPLPEKTASGSIAHITDGADTVPIKAWDVTVDANLDGVSSVKVTQAGKNLLNPSYLENGYSLSNTTGLPFASSGRIATTTPVPIRGGATITVSWDSSIQNVYYIYSILKNGTLVERVANKTNGSSFNTQDADSIYICLFQSQATPITISDFNYIQIEVGSTASTFEAYTASIVTTVTLGRTIYGGTADVVNGTGTDGFIKYELDDNDSWSPYSGAGHSFWHNVATGEDRPIDQTKLSKCICNHLTYSSSAPASAPDFSFVVQGGQRIVVTADSTIDTVDKFKTWLQSNPLVFACPAASPTDFTFTPMTPTPQTPLGTSNFWADTGDSEVTYRADIALALAANPSRGLMMASRSIPEDEILNENTEEVENDENIRQDSTDR